MLPGLKSAAAIHRPSVRPEGMTKTRYSSGPGGAERVRLAHLQDQVGRAERPVGGPDPRRRAVLRIALRGTRLGPVRQGLPLPIVQHPAPRNGPPSVVEACQGGMVRCLGHRRDVVGALPRLRVIQQRERRDLPGPMAFLAVLLEDRGHVAVIGRELGAAGRRAGPERDRDEQGRAEARPTGARVMDTSIVRSLRSDLLQERVRTGRRNREAPEPSDPSPKDDSPSGHPGFKNRPHHRPDRLGLGRSERARLRLIGPGRRSRR